MMMDQPDLVHVLRTMAGLGYYAARAGYLHEAADEIERLRAEVAETQEHAHRLADEAIEDERAMRDEAREIEWRAKEDGFRAGQEGHW